MDSQFGTCLIPSKHSFLFCHLACANDIGIDGCNLEFTERKSNPEKVSMVVAMSKSKTLCFNKLIRDELDTEKRGRQSLSKLILEWVFSERQRRQKRKHCCDACFRQKNSRPLSYFAEDVIKTMPSRVTEIT